jgi:RsiW-degrading membrane proteinase PrsW (M82 family)
MILFALLLVFIGVAIGLAWYLLAHDHGAKEPIGMLWLAVGFGLVGAIVASLIENWLLSANNLQPGTPYGTLLLTALAVGVIEESCKFIPLALVIYRRPFFNENTDGIIYFALAGLGFGLPENILYTLQFGAKTGVLRLVLVPFLHAATTGVVGYFLIKRKLAGKSPWWVVLPLGAMMLVHGLYDFGLSSGSAVFTIGSLVITIGLSIGLFRLFMRASELDRSLGLSVVGHNSFCRSCGYPNQQHHLYCVRCGKNA